MEKIGEGIYNHFKYEFFYIIKDKYLLLKIIGRDRIIKEILYKKDIEVED